MGRKVYRKISNVESFVHALHRRLVVVRLLERIGAATLAAEILVSPLIAILLLRAQNAAVLVFSALALGIVAGVAWSIARHPARMDAAMEADRQLGLADLLGTALAMMEAKIGSADDSCREMVLVMADARCRGLSPSRVVVARYGGRMWGGIGLVSCAVIGAGLISARTGSLKADAFLGDQTAFVSPDELGKEPAQGSVVNFGMRKSQAPELKAGASDVRQIGEAGATDSTTTVESHYSFASRAGEKGDGAGIGQTAESIASKGLTPVASGEHQDASQGQSAAGAGKSGQEMDGKLGKGGMMGQGTDVQTGGAWQGMKLGDDRRREGKAGSAVTNVPDVYRDLITDYFNGQ